MFRHADSNSQPVLQLMAQRVGRVGLAMGAMDPAGRTHRPLHPPQQPITVGVRRQRLQACHFGVDRNLAAALHAVDAIPQVTRRVGCDIVVMGALARSGLKGLFIGNTPNGCSTTSPATCWW